MGTRYLEPPNTEHKPTIKKIQLFFHFLTKLNNFYVIGNIIGWLQMVFESQSKGTKEQRRKQKKKKMTSDILFQKFWRKSFRPSRCKHGKMKKIKIEVELVIFIFLTRNGVKSRH